VESKALSNLTQKRFLDLDLETQTHRAFLSENSLRRLRLNRQVIDELFVSLAQQHEQILPPPDRPSSAVRVGI
jgi:hypothetical protein